jgi:hypothetical protein
MITTAILYILYGAVYLVTLPISSLQDASLPSWLAGALFSINGIVASLYAVMPLTTNTLLAALKLMITIEVAVFAYKGIMWVIHRIPGQGGGSPG